jgi:hypothetical protein
VQVNFKDLQPVVDEGQAYTFLERLTRDMTGYIGISLIGQDGKVRAGFGTVADLFEELDTGNFFTEFIKFGRQRWNIYVSVGAFSVVPEVGSRGFANQIGEIPGVWADFDVKPGQADGFQSAEELNAFLDTLPPMTMRVSTGSGGVHGYWLFDEPLLEMPVATRLLQGWHAYLSEKAGDKHIDNVQELARILRIPGTVRWPKPGESSGPAKVELVFHQGPTYQPSELLAISKGALAARKTAHKKKSDGWIAKRTARQDELTSSGFLLDMKKRDAAERFFNERQDWSVLLERAGWTLHKDGRGSSVGTTSARYWSQPGMGSGYSAMTDYPGSDLIVFYTAHPDWDAVSVPFMTDRSGRRMSTKFYFALGALFGGDEKALLLAIAHGGGVLQ